MNTTTDRRTHLADLLIASGAGNERAFSELHALTNQYLYHVALRLLGAPSCAEEVLQDAYVNIWTHARRFRPGEGSPMTWLIAIVRNGALSRLRSRRLEQQRTEAAAEAAWLAELAIDDSDASDPIRQAFYDTLRRRLPEALARLEPAQRQSIALTFGQGMPHAELSAHMDAPLGTVKSWLRRGMARLRENLVQEPAAGTVQPPRPGRTGQSGPAPDAANDLLRHHARLGASPVPIAR
ncbi:RNA polymerase sigma factor [Pseudoduganella umbonata]|nr:sigma-70 family RNA polymerase sigma factor [Pseudoduganella umbonata]MBB3221220.1 RNA polymerase sigma-70 factor (ECF subfamily) [Pseudoduganella umbonata]